ncbi:MAG: DUF4197 domain-containing protein, partial [Ferruginibacter sp.]
MKKFFIAMVGIGVLSGCDVLKQLPQSGGPGTVTQIEAAQGIKQALSQGLVKATLQLNKQDGFFGNTFYKILLPPDAKKVENALRTIGLGKQVDKAILQINRGAEDAVGFAQPIFIDAIKQMTLTDAINIVRGGDTSATHYFRTKTMQQLTGAFLPVIKSSLNKVEATKYYGDIVNTYNNFPTTFTKVNPDLAGFVTDRATNALFDLVAKED